MIRAPKGAFLLHILFLFSSRSGFMRTSLCILLFLPALLTAQPWTPRASFPLPGRDDGTAFTIGNYMYFGTGMQVGFSLTNDLWRYEPGTDSWSQMASMPCSLRQYCASFVTTRAYVLTGIDNNNIYLNDVWEYDPAGNS